MNDLIRNYYLGERATALLAASLGVFLLVSSLTLFRIAPRATVQRGIAYVFLVAGLFFGLTGGGYDRVVQQRMIAHEIKAHGGSETKEAEIVRMEGVVKSSYRGALRMFTTVLCAGLLVACFSKGSPIRQGIAVGLIVFGTMGHTTEAISMHKNREYLKRVQGYRLFEARGSGSPITIN
jgi:ABC-type Mn2+/Zn2+ transport system permease subunit